jgi:YHS domain-containing protein
MKPTKYLAPVLLLLSHASVFAADEYATPAIEGYDPVAYFIEHKPVRGSANYTTKYEGKFFLFSNAADKAEFEKHPDKYLPQYGGWCSFGVAMGKKFYADPTVWTVANDKLYLNSSKNIQEKWSAKRNQMIQDADQNWVDIKSKDAEKL